MTLRLHIRHLGPIGLLVALLGCHGVKAQDTSAVWVREAKPPQYFAVRVADVDRSVDWYRSVFGLENIGGSEGEDGSWRIENLRNEHLLVEIIRDDRAKVVDRAPGFSKVGFEVPDVEAVAERVAMAAGDRPRVLDFARFGVRILQIRDPDGNIIQLSSPFEPEVSSRLPQADEGVYPGEETRVVIENQGWQLVGDLRMPASTQPVPAVLMLNKAAGDRASYEHLARHLAQRGIASLRVDLRGHGESTNLGRFVPGERPRDSLIWDAEVDVVAAHGYLKSHARIDEDRVAILGGSYSGEEMAEAGRVSGYAQAYVALSPGSFSDESISGIDSSGVPWLFVASNNERFLKEITAAVQEQSQTVELLIVPGTKHASDILGEQPGLSERIAVWLAHRLQ